MTYKALCKRLALAGIENAAWEASLLLEHFCSVSPALLPLESEKDYQSQALEDAVSRREERYPLQYLLGQWQFYRQTYKVTPDCLIPRSDTEILVEEAIRILPEGARFADLCTGSGCIAVSVLAERPDTVGYALEKFERTLSLAKENAGINGVSNRFLPLLGDVLTEPCPFEEGSLDAILCNPPYIPSAVVPTLERELFCEPQAALDGGEDGLVFYRRILASFGAALKDGGVFLFEIGYDQADALRALGKAAGFDDCHVLRDLGGNDRVVALRRADA